MPQYVMIKQKVNIEGLDPDNIIEKMTEKYKDQPVDLLDGLKIDFENSWVHLRKSNTEPIMRVISEAPTEDEAVKLGQRFMDEVKNI